MGSLGDHEVNMGRKVEEKKIMPQNEGNMENVYEMPLDVKDYEELGLVIGVSEGEGFEKTNIDFNAMFSDFSWPEEEPETYDQKELSPEATATLMELEKWMESSPENEADELGTINNWCLEVDDHKIMEWLWYPNSYEEFCRFYQGIS